MKRFNKAVILAYTSTLIALSSCNSSLKYDTYSHKATIPPIPVKVANLKNSERVALIMPPDGDNIDWNDNSLVNLLKSNDYGIVITQNHSQNRFIDKDSWISYAYGSYTGLKADSLIPQKPENFIIIAFEDAGYTLPTLCELLKPDFYIAINTGPYNPLKEMELLVKDTSGLSERFYRDNDITDEEEMIERIRRVKNNSSHSQDLFSKTNQYWLSFYEDNLYESILKANVPGLFIFSRDYSRLTDLSKISLKSMIPPGPIDSTVVTIPGAGRFSTAEEVDVLTKAVDIYISSLR